MLHKLIFLLGLTAIGWPDAARVAAAALSCDLNVPASYATVGAAVTVASNGQVICVAAGSYTDAYFDLATKGLTLQGAQAGVDARTRPARLWASEDPLPEATETVFTYSGQNWCRVTGGLGATIDGIFMPSIGARALDDQTNSGSNDVIALTIKNSIFKSTDEYTDNQNGIVQFAAGPSASTNNIHLRQNYIETFTRTFLYAVSTRCNDWLIESNEIRSYYFSFGPFVGDDATYPGGLIIQNNFFGGDIPGNPPSRASSPPGYDGLAFNAVLGNVVVTGNTFTKIIRGLGSVWLYGATIQGNTFTDNYLDAMSLRSSDSAGKPASHDVTIENNVIEYNGTPIVNGDDAAFLSQGIWINRPSGGSTSVNASTIHINFNSLVNLDVSGGTQVWAIRQDGVGAAPAMDNYWGESTSDIRVNGSVETTPWIVSYQDDPNKLGDPGFWPISIVYGALEGEPVTTPTGTDVSIDFLSNTSTESVGNITFGEITTAGVTTVTPVTPDPSDPNYVPPINFMLGDPPVYFDIETTATLAGTAQVCFIYPPGSIPAGTLPNLYHYFNEEWIDITTSRDTSTGTICGTTSQFSPFAVGFVLFEEGALDVKALRLVSKARADSDSWSVIGTIDTGNFITVSALLDSLTAVGIAFEVYGGTDALVDAVVFEGEGCKRIGWGASSKKAGAICRIKAGGTTVRAKFKRTSSAGSNDEYLRVFAKFPRRSFSISSFTGLVPIDVHVVSPMGIVFASDNMACKAKPSKVICKTA